MSRSRVAWPKPSLLVSCAPQWYEIQLSRQNLPWSFYCSCFSVEQNILHNVSSQLCDNHTDTKTERHRHRHTQPHRHTKASSSTSQVNTKPMQSFPEMFYLWVLVILITFVVVETHKTKAHLFSFFGGVFLLLLLRVCLFIYLCLRLCVCVCVCVCVLGWVSQTQWWWRVAVSPTFSIYFCCWPRKDFFPLSFFLLPSLQTFSWSVPRNQHKGCLSGSNALQGGARCPLRMNVHFGLHSSQNFLFDGKGERVKFFWFAATCHWYKWICIEVKQRRQICFEGSCGLGGFSR